MIRVRPRFQRTPPFAQQTRDVRLQASFSSRMQPIPTPKTMLRALPAFQSPASRSACEAMSGHPCAAFFRMGSDAASRVSFSSTSSSTSSPTSTPPPPASSASSSSASSSSTNVTEASPPTAVRLDSLEQRFTELEQRLTDLEQRVTKTEKKGGFFARFMGFFQEYGTPFIVIYGTAYFGMWGGILLLFEMKLLPDPLVVLEAVGLELPEALASRLPEAATTNEEGTNAGSFRVDGFWVRVLVSFLLNEALEVPRFLLVAATFKPLLRLLGRG